MFTIQDREAGNVIAKFETYDQAYEELLSYENLDYEDGNYTPNFYKIIEITGE